MISPAARGQKTPLNLSTDLVSLGIASSNMVPNRRTLDAGPLLTQGLLYAESNHVPLVIADPGSYYFLSLGCPACHLSLLGQNNRTVDFQGAQLIFTHPLQGAIYLGYSANFVFENFSVDYQPLPFTQVRVTSVNAAQAQIQYALDGNWQDPTTFNSAQRTPGAEAIIVEVHIFRNGQPAPGLGRMGAQNPFTAGSFTLIPYDFPPTAANVAKTRPGDLAVLTMRSFFSAIEADRCTGCTFRNVTIYSSPGGGVGTHFLDLFANVVAAMHIGYLLFVVGGLSSGDGGCHFGCHPFHPFGQGRAEA